MKIVHYESDAPWVGKLKCQHCKKTTPAWRSSGMSESCPHFFCDTCSNVILRDIDYVLLREQDLNQALLDEISSTLPNCDCGGQFAPSNKPKCSHCGSEIGSDYDPVINLGEPRMIIVDGAKLYNEKGVSYEVCIGTKSKYEKRVRELDCD